MTNESFSNFFPQLDSGGIKKIKKRFNVSGYELCFGRNTESFQPEPLGES